MMNPFNNFLSEVAIVTKYYYQERLEKLVLYGSYARNEQNEGSDVDLMIVLKDEKINAGKEILSFGGTIYPIGWKHGHLINILPTTHQKAFHSKLSVYHNARIEGITIA